MDAKYNMDITLTHINGQLILESYKFLYFTSLL